MHNSVQTLPIVLFGNALKLYLFRFEWNMFALLTPFESGLF